MLDLNAAIDRWSSTQDCRGDRLELLALLRALLLIFHRNIISGYEIDMMNQMFKVYIKPEPSGIYTD